MHTTQKTLSFPIVNSLADLGDSLSPDRGCIEVGSLQWICLRKVLGFTKFERERFAPNWGDLRQIFEKSPPPKIFSMDSIFSLMIRQPESFCFPHGKIMIGSISYWVLQYFSRQDFAHNLCEKKSEKNIIHQNNCREIIKKAGIIKFKYDLDPNVDAIESLVKYNPNCFVRPECNWEK